MPRNIQTKVPRNNAKVHRNNPVTQSSDARARAPLENIQSSSWYNSNLSSEMYSRSSDCNPVPRTNLQDSNDVRKQVVSSSLPPKRKRDRKHRRERRAREREERGEAFNHDARWASQRPGDPSSSSVPAQVTQSGLQDSDPISAMRPEVYYPSESVGNPLTNENSPIQLTWSLVNSQAYAQAYINRPIQPLSTTLGPSLLRRTARKKDLPHLP